MDLTGNFVLWEPYACTLLAPGELLYYSERYNGIYHLLSKDGSFVCTRLVPIAIRTRPDDTIKGLTGFVIRTTVYGKIEGLSVTELKNSTVPRRRIEALSGIKDDDGNLSIAWIEAGSLEAKLFLARCHKGQDAEIQEIWSTRHLAVGKPIIHFFGPDDVLCLFHDATEHHFYWRTMEDEGWVKVFAVRFKDGKILYSRFLNKKGKYWAEDASAFVRDDGTFTLAWVQNLKADSYKYDIYMQDFSGEGMPIGEPRHMLDLLKVGTPVDYRLFSFGFTAGGREALVAIGKPSAHFKDSADVGIYRFGQAGARLIREWPNVTPSRWLGFDANRGVLYLLNYEKGQNGDALFILSGYSESDSFQERIKVSPGGFNKSLFMIDQPMTDIFYWLEDSPDGLKLKEHAITHGTQPGSLKERGS
jgi:hypothetical protein